MVDAFLFIFFALLNPVHVALSNASLPEKHVLLWIMMSLVPFTHFVSIFITQCVLLDLCSFCVFAISLNPYVQTFIRPLVFLDSKRRRHV